MAGNVLFLCTGNICRSPVAEAVARQMYGAQGITFSSAGLDARDGLPASLDSAVYALETGTSLDDHTSRPVTGAILAEVSWVIGMTRSHAAIFKSRYGKAFEGHVGVLGAPGVDLASLAHSPDMEEVDDPYGGPTALYMEACEQIRRLLAGWDACFRELTGGKETTS
jgi:protein-tyrosine-phosphatase